MIHRIEDIERGHTALSKLSDEQIAALHEMMLSSGWRVYTRALDHSIKDFTEVLISATSDVNVEHLRGQVSGMRLAALLPSALISGAEYARTAIERARQQPRSNNPILRALATWGTPSWRNRAADDDTPASP